MENNNYIKLCEHCKEEVAYNVRRCPYCGSLLNNHTQTAYMRPQETVRPDALDTESNISSSSINTNNINSNTSPVNDGQAYSEYMKQDNEQRYNEQRNNDYRDNDYRDNDYRDNEQVSSEPDSGGFKEYKSYQQPVNNQVNYGTGYYGDTDVYDIKPLSNKTKVFLTALSSFVPWLGQLVGIIAAIVYMNSEDDDDRRSFGRALLVSSLIVFLITSFMILFTISAFSNIR